MMQELVGTLFTDVRWKHCAVRFSMEGNKVQYINFAMIIIGNFNAFHFLSQVQLQLAPQDFYVYIIIREATCTLIRETGYS